MKKIKRGLSLVLALILLVSVFSVAAGAASVSITNTLYGYMMPTDSKFTEGLSTVKLFGNYDYFNFYITSRLDNLYFFYEIYTDKNYTNLVTGDFIQCNKGTYSWSPFIKLTGVFKTGTFYCVTYAARIDSQGNATVSSSSMKEFKLSIDRTSAFNKRMVLMKATSNTVNGPKITWYNTVSGVDKFFIYRRSINGTKWTRVGIVNNKTFSFTDTSVKNRNGKYVYTVKGVAKNGVATRYHYSGILALYAYAPKLTATPTSDNRMLLSWNKTSNSTLYYIYRKENGSGWKRIAQTKGTSYYDTLSANGNVYQYTVRALISTAQGNATSSFYSGTNLKFIKSPTIKDCIAVDGKVNVSWELVPEATGYTIYRRAIDSTGAWTNVGRVAGDVASFTDESSSAAESYTYTVRSEGNGIRGSYDSKGKLHLTLSAPVLSKTPTDESLMVTFSSVPNANYYELLSKNADGNWEYVSETSYLYIYATPKTGVNEMAIVAARRNNGSLIKSNPEESKFTFTYFHKLKLVARNFNDHIELSWNDCKIDESYNVYRRVAGEENYNLIAENLTECTYKDYTAEKDVSYEYCVRYLYEGAEKTDKEGTASCTNVTLPEDKSYGVHIIYAEEFTENKFPSDIHLHRSASIEFAGLAPEDKVYVITKNGEYQELSIGAPGTTQSRIIIDQKIPEGFVYKFAVRYYVDGQYTSFDGDVKEITYKRNISKPNVTFSNGEDYYYATLNAIPGAVDYEFAKSSDVGYSHLIETDSDEYVLFDKIESNGSTKYTVKAENELYFNSFETTGDETVIKITMENGDIYYFSYPSIFCDTPTLIKATRISDTSVKFYYSTRTSHTCIIYRKTATSGWERIGTQSSSSHQTNVFVDNTAKKGVEYTYTVRAVRSDGIKSGFDSQGVTCTKN